MFCSSVFVINRVKTFHASSLTTVQIVGIYSVHGCIGDSDNFGDAAGAPHPWDEDVADPLETRNYTPHFVIRTKFGRCRSYRMNVSSGVPKTGEGDTGAPPP